MRLIDADAIFPNGVFVCRGDAADAVQEIMVRINQSPTIDAVPVVRCKDCFYYKSFGECGNTGEPVIPDDFCSYGERKEDEHES